MKNALVGLAFAAIMFVSATAYAWGVYQYRADGTVVIRCQDESYALVGPDNGSWTVYEAGNQGSTGGNFAIMGGAALYGCGE